MELLAVIHTYTTTNAKICDKNAKLYQARAFNSSDDILVNFLDKMSSTPSLSPNSKIHLSLLFQIIGETYIDSFHSLISSSWGQFFSIEEQVAEKMKFALNASTSDLFLSNPKAAKHAYYITGFIGLQGKKESARQAEEPKVR